MPISRTKLPTTATTGPGIKKTKIPEVLQLAASAPYSLVGIKTCVQINREIIALGADTMKIDLWSTNNNPKSDASNIV